MKQIFTLSILVCFLVQLNSQTLIWGGSNDPNSTFANGLGAWTTIGIFSSKPEATVNAIWSHTADGKSKGAYSDLAGAINSPSKADGAAIFDSDFLDNGGVEGNEGLGIAPSPHSGALISPEINCGNAATVSVSFYQYYQNYLSSCTLEVSSDNGTTWTSYPINENVKPGTGTLRGNRQVIDISNSAANKSKVIIRFVFSGDYYFWIIDDVALYTLPENDLGINSVYYAPSNYATPKSQICKETWNFKGTISNLGANPQSGVQYKVEIIGSDRKSRVYADSIYLSNNLNSNDDNVPVATPKTFDPGTLMDGKYYIRTSLNYNNTDYNPADNSRLDSFEVTGFLFVKEPRSRIGIRANGGTPYAVAAQYRTSDCWGANDKFVAKTVNVGMNSGLKSAGQDYSVKVYLTEVRSEVAADFSNFDSLKGINSSSLIILSDQELKAKVDQSLKAYSLDILNQANERVELKKNTRYILICSHPAEADAEDLDTWRYHVSSNEKNYDGHPYSVPVFDNDGNWFNSWPDGESPLLRLEISVITKTDEKPLQENVLSVQPNPIQNNILQLNLNFNTITDANITIFDMTGKVLDFQSYKNLTSNQLSIPVSELNSGEYFVRVSTNEGTKTKKFIKL
ncbi:MAG: T9SS type A sorting domain-containing protein [Saprospiraceae bacterium]|nr:T9SS type A sorting domain-containing protein [Saprospiraceae bacterium]